MLHKMNFDEKYFENLWGSVHRHDYADSWISVFKQDYPGIKSSLDIGTGCGHLVKRLREEGYDAWGTEVSEYALENTCAPGYVVYGDVRDLPFKDNKFDLVFSSGLWSYIPEDEVPGAVAECHRVGKIQRHNIDHDKCLKIPGFATWKSIEWWNEKLARPKVLVACPTHISKEYSFQKWIDVVKNLTYPNYDIFVVDNSPNGEMVEKYGSQIPMVHLKVDSEDRLVRINKSMEVIRQKFLNGNYEKWFNLECDVIPETDILDILMKFKEADWVGHAYPIRERGDDIQVSSGIGCSILSRRVVEDWDFSMVDESPDAALWAVSGQMKTMELYHFNKVKHLKD